ncbi:MULTISPECIES: galactokinase [unclassified Streptomyces]|uniref:galactokinase n=1 Tax=unclassified Streptomyces TaxID=2593676 RepID=UPI002030F218|nr:MULTISPECIES: galactokinase [unclassified Streptomyces]MCM1966557.1 galactokinase [Streptomyces sp. G1]MCX5128442.1 galactokinase [Streptomyces sp. NBC_00347]
MTAPGTPTAPGPAGTGPATTDTADNGPAESGPVGTGPAAPPGGDLARRATADPLFRLVAYALEAAHGRPPAAVWSAPYTFHLGSPGLVAAAGWPVAAAAAPRTDGLVRLSSLAHPADGCDLPLALSGPPPATPAWAARPYALLRALARAGYGRGGTDLHVQGSLTQAAGLATEEAADCAVALAVADVHTPPGEDPDRALLAGLMAEALPDGDDALRRGALFARPGRALLLGHRPAGPEPRRHRQRYVVFDPVGSGSRLVLLALRPDPDGTQDRTAELARAVGCARRAGALSAWPPGQRPGRSVLVLLPEARLTSVRAAVAADFRDRGLPVPRFLNITVAGAARREA